MSSESSSPGELSTEVVIQRDPFEVLGLSIHANEAEIRLRYLELVRENPPDRDPERFREIQSAYDAAKDPSSLAQHVIKRWIKEDPPSWDSVIDQHARKTPSMPFKFLMSLGNKA